MNQPEFRFISFKEPLLETVIQQMPARDALAILPSELSCKAAIRLYQNVNRLQNVQFLTIERFKELLFLPDKPLLKEEKRTLAFYASMDASDREFFKIHNYFQSIELANHFFELWGEFNEEGIPQTIDGQQLADRGIDLLPWQQQTFERLCKIKKNYHDFIQSKGFTDAIFLQDAEHLDLSFVNPFRTILFINQFYYTRLEKEIIKRLLQSDRTVIVYSQLPQHLLHREDFTVTPFSFAELGDGRTRELAIHQCPNTFTMMTALLRALEDHGIRQMVQVGTDVHFLQRFFSLEKFHLSGSVPMASTSVYGFFSALYGLVSELIIERERQQILLPITAIVQAMQQPDFSRFFIKPEEPVAEALSSLRLLLADQFQYIDLNENFFKQQNPRIKNAQIYIIPIIDLLKKVIQINNVSHLCDLVDQDQGIHLRNILTEDEQTYSDIRDVFYRSLADFSMLEQVGIVEDWNSFFPAEAPFNLAKGILRLFLDYIKSKRVHYTLMPFSQDRVNVTDLQDTRNLSYQKIAIINLCENKLPSSRKTPFLFTEKQRRMLGLKTYDDIRMWEKYYFYRLILNSEQVHLFTLKNEEKDIDTSSFVEEIRRFLPREKWQWDEVPDFGYRSLYLRLTPPDDTYSPKPFTKEDFFTIPYEAGEDFERLRLSPTGFSLLKRNPFEFYLRKIAAVPEPVSEEKVGMDDRLLGTVAHEYFRRIVQAYLHDTELSMPLHQLPERYAARVQQAIFEGMHDFYYKLPHDHHGLYLRHIMMPLLKEGCQRFFDHLQSLLPEDASKYRLYPEEDFTIAAEQNAKVFLRAEENDLGVDVEFYGRADLRVERIDQTKKYLFDYKTGSGEYEQLLIYQLYYYLIDDPSLAEQVHAEFFYILKKEFKTLNNLLPKQWRNLPGPLLIMTFRENIQTILAAITVNGFVMSKRINPWDTVKDIMRVDLMPDRKQDSRLVSI